MKRPFLVKPFDPVVGQQHPRLSAMTVDMLHQTDRLLLYHVVAKVDLCQFVCAEAVGGQA